MIRSEPSDRIMAHLVDTASIFVPIMFPVIFDGDMGFVLAAAGLLGVCAWHLIGIHRTGQSIGKRLLKIQVVRVDGRRAGAPRVALLRNVAPAIIGQVPVVGWLVGIVNVFMLFGEERRCVHDYIAGTVVVDAPERHPFLME
jgi:uncharacterized RDD family membrane protein YckC